MTKPSLFSQRRTLQRRNTSKREPKLDKVFDCLFCNHSKCVICKLDFERKAGTLICETCPARYSCIINHLSKEVDVYGEWVDSLETPKQLAQTKSRLQATLTAAPPTSAPTHTQAQTEEEEPLVRPTRTKTSSLLSATTRTQIQAQALDCPSQSQSCSSLPRSEALAPVHDRPSREQSLVPLPNHEQSYSPLPPLSPQAQAQPSLSVPTPVQAQFQLQFQPQPHVKERVAASVSPYHDQNDDNASHMLQHGSMAVTNVVSAATVSPGQPWIQGNNRQQGYSERQGHGFNRQQGYENNTNTNNQDFGPNNSYNSNHGNYGYSFQIQGYGFINTSFGGHQNIGGNNQGYGGIQDIDENNHSFGGNQVSGNNSNQRFRNNHQRFRNKACGTNNQAYGTNNNQRSYGANNRSFRKYNQAYGNNNNQAYGASNQGRHGTQFSGDYNNNRQNNDIFSTSSHSSGYNNNNVRGGNLGDYDACRPAGNTGGSPHDYASGNNTRMQYNTTGGYSDH